MAKDLYESRQMYQSPIIFYILIPIGMVILFFLIDFGIKIYNEYTLKRDTQEILKIVMESDAEDLKSVAVKEFERRGYETDDVSVIERDNGILLVNYKSYFSMIGEIIGGNKSVAVARYFGYYDEHKELVIEEYGIEDEELDETTDDDAITIPAT